MSHLCWMCHRKATSCWHCWGLDPPDFLELGVHGLIWAQKIPAFSASFSDQFSLCFHLSELWTPLLGCGGSSEVLLSRDFIPLVTCACSAGLLFPWLPHPPIHPVEDTHGKTTFVLSKDRLFSWLLFSKQSSVTAASTAALVGITSHREMAERLQESGLGSVQRPCCFT